MHTLKVLLVAAAAACVIARPGLFGISPPRKPPPRPVIPQQLRAYLMSGQLLPQYLNYDESPVMPPALPDESDNDWLNKEINRISDMEEEDDPIIQYDADVPTWVNGVQYADHEAKESVGLPIIEALLDDSPDSRELEPEPNTVEPKVVPVKADDQKKKDKSDEYAKNTKKYFALTPLDAGYYDPEVKTINRAKASTMGVKDEEKANILEPPRAIRQSPNLSRTKTLVAENLGQLRTGLSYEGGEGTAKPRHLHVYETAAPDPAQSIYGVALLAAVCVALTMAILGFAFGWYTLSKKAKAAAEVDYPAYGVTGPTQESSGDRKLAHSAHMYHYQHQKQQIIAMERSGIETRNGSVSDPESEEENEEGDYTVYECPGFATTGNMEVKNPMFKEDPTPATGKCELVRPQPKE